MINLDEIELRFHRGQYAPNDVANLLSEVRDVISPEAINRLDKGIRQPADLDELLSVTEELYKQVHDRPTAAERVAEEKAVAAEAEAQAEAERAERDAKKTYEEEVEAQERVALSKQVAELELEAVQNKIGKERRDYEEEAARVAREFKKKIALDARAQLEYEE